MSAAQDKPKSKPASNEYRDNYDRIFRDKQRYTPPPTPPTPPAQPGGFQLENEK